MATEYPKREPFFANRAVRLLFKSCAIMDIGDLAALIVIMVAHQEDAARYRGPVRFWNREFRDTLGASENRVNRARKRAIDTGWLHYEPRDIGSGNNRSVGLYWVTIPDGLESLDDSPVGDVITHSDEGNSEGNAASITNASEGKTGGMVKGMAGESLRESRGNGVDTSFLDPTPTPKPSPKPKKNGSGKKKGLSYFELIESDDYEIGSEFVDNAGFIASWDRWVEFRKEIKAPLTASMVKSQWSKFTGMGLKRSVAMIEHTIFKGWRGLREEESGGSSGYSNEDPRGNIAAVQRFMEGVDDE